MNDHLAAPEKRKSANQAVALQSLPLCGPLLGWGLGTVVVQGLGIWGLVVGLGLGISGLVWALATPTSGGLSGSYSPFFLAPSWR